MIQLIKLMLKMFLSNINNKKIRTQITNEEYGFTYQIASKYSLTKKIILPIFQPRDIIDLFFQYNENNRFTNSINE